MTEESRLYIFASIDIANSTSYKHHNGNWFNILIKFYNGLPENIIKSWYKLAQKAKDDSVLLDIDNRPHLWKTMGDEIALVMELTDPYQAVIFVNCPCFGPKPSSLDEKRLQPFFLS